METDGPAPTTTQAEEAKSAGYGYSIPPRYTHRSYVAITELSLRLSVTALTLIALCLVASDYGFTVVVPLK